ncbi:MAG: hypothetical protein KJO78_14615, partial [Alphaproteobacteria bacterium]|nr:hypothetical protein [Alphaproteobacteria bacterium]
MTESASNAETQSPRDILEAALGHFKNSIKFLQTLEATACEGDAAALGEAQKSLRALQSATQTAFDMHKKVDDETRKQNGIVHDY